MKVNVYGSTLTAWVAAACLAKVGNDVVLYEGGMFVAPTLQSLAGISVIRDEPGLLEQIRQQVDSGRLKRSVETKPERAVIHWLALESNDQPQVENIIDAIADAGASKSLVVNQCNFEVGATAKLQNRLAKKSSHALLAYIPDNLEQGGALHGFVNPKQIIVGIDDEDALVLINALLKPLGQSLDHLQIMTSKEAEFAKFATTGMLAIRLGYINELANLADQLDVDIDVIRQAMGVDPRIGKHYLSPGCGFGGQNFHAYISKFSDIFQEKGSQSLLKVVIDENEIQKELLFRKLWQHYEGDLDGKKVALWGVSYKPGTASIDNAPSLKIINALLSQGVEVNIHDPEAMHNLQAKYAGEGLVLYHEDMYQAVESCDAMILVTEWPQYLSPDYDRLYAEMRTPLIIDGRNVFDKQMLETSGFTYMGVGR